LLVLDTSSSHIGITPDLKYGRSKNNNNRAAVKDLITEISKRNPDQNYKIQLSTLIDVLTGPEFGFTLLKAVQMIRWLTDQGSLIPSDNSLVSFLLRRNISEYTDRQRRLQIAWLAADEIAILEILREEKEELSRSAVLKFDIEGREQKRQRRKRRRELKQEIQMRGGRFRY
jgi:hypothetical protein